MLQSSELATTEQRLSNVVWTTLGRRCTNVRCSLGEANDRWIGQHIFCKHIRRQFILHFEV